MSRRPEQVQASREKPLPGSLGCRGFVGVLFLSRATAATVAKCLRVHLPSLPLHTSHETKLRHGRHCETAGQPRRLVGCSSKPMSIGHLRGILPPKLFAKSFSFLRLVVVHSLLVSALQAQNTTKPGRFH